eukprot:SAG11_NODE_1689_length_4443_cov_7.468002_2_plen_345_part_00
MLDSDIIPTNHSQATARMASGLLSERRIAVLEALVDKAYGLAEDLAKRSGALAAAATPAVETVATERIITAEELRANENCWVVIGRTVYDVAPYLDQHPGGRAVLLGVCGNDATVEFEAIHSPGVLAEHAAAFAIGTLSSDALVSSGMESTAQAEELPAHLLAAMEGGAQQGQSARMMASKDVEELSEGGAVGVDRTISAAELNAIPHLGAMEELAMAHLPRTAQLFGPTRSLFDFAASQNSDTAQNSAPHSTYTTKFLISRFWQSPRVRRPAAPLLQTMRRGRGGRLCRTCYATLRMSTRAAQCSATRCACRSSLAPRPFTIACTLMARSRWRGRRMSRERRQ